MAKNELIQAVRNRLNDLGKKPIPAALEAGLGRTYFTDLFKDGRKGSIQESKIEQVAEACNWTVDELRSAVRGGSSPRPRQRQGARGRVLEVPLLDSVAAGHLTSPLSQIPSERKPLISVSGLGPGEYFALRVSGTSMDKVSPDGSVIVVTIKDRELQDGKFYVFSLNGDTTYKRWNANGGFLEPYTTDPDAHRPIIIRKKGDATVIGRVRRTLLDL